MKSRSSLAPSPAARRLLALLVIASSASSGLVAANSTYSGASGGNWSDALNWSAGVPGVLAGPFTDTSVVTFNTAISSVVLDGSYNVKDITFTSPADQAFTLSAAGGRSLLLSSGGTLLNSSVSPTAAGNVVQTVSAPIILQTATGNGVGSGAYAFNASGGSGASANRSSTLNITGSVTGSSDTGNVTTLTLTGNNNTRTLAANEVGGVIGDGSNGGRLAVAFTTPTGNASTVWLLSGVNTYSGGTTLTRAGTSTGTLRINNNASLGTGAVTFNGLASLQQTAALTLSNAVVFSGNGGAIDTNGSAMSISGLVTGSGTWTKNGTGTLSLGNTGNTHSGAVTVANGALSLATLASVPTFNLGTTTVAGSLIYTGSGQTSSAVINLNGTTGGATIDQSGTGALVLTGANTATGAGIKTLTLTGSTAGTGEISGAIINNSGTNTTAVTKSGTGTWTLSGANSYSGATTVSGGTLKVGNVSALGTSSVTLAVGGTLDLNGRAIANAFGTNTTRGTLTNTGSAVDLSATTISNTGLFTVDGSGGITLGTVTGTNAANQIVKNGANTLTLAGGADNSWLGLTVNSGSVVLAKASTGGIKALNGLTINGGTVTLGGSGGNQIGDTVSLGLNGGTFATGGLSETLGTLVLGGSGSLDFGSGTSSLIFANSSGLVWTGTLSLLNFNVGTDSLSFSSIGGLNGTQLGQISLAGYTITGLDAGGFVQFASTIPEPSTFAAFAGLGVLGLAAARRRRA